MNDLSLFNSNQSKEVVTTKQLAEILGVDVRTVQLTVQHLGFAKVLSQSMELVKKIFKGV
jgi:Mn-dependent DtxR family transcriptional regulator